MRWITTALALCILAVPTQAWAQERDYCPARPGLGTPACTIAPGRVSAEIGIADWERDDTVDARDDTVTIGDTLLRIGVSDIVEAQLGWTPYGHLRSRDKASGSVSTADGVGDALVGVKVNLKNPDGSGFSVAVQPYAVLPVGQSPLGSGDWSVGAVVPMSVDLSDAFNLQFSPEVDAAANGSGNGRHLAYSGVVGLGYAASDQVGVTLEFQAARDEDPAEHTTELLGAVSAAWMPTERLQLDIGANLGLNRDAPDVELYFGISRRF